MALGGGTFKTQNKKLPGSYINFVSVASNNSALSERGYAALGLELNYGPEGKIITVTADKFYDIAEKTFGYSASSEELTNIRETLKNANVLYLYRLNGGGTKASNKYAEAKYGGTRGNDIKIVISANVDTPSKKDVSTYLGTKLVDTQTVTDNTELVANDYVTFKDEALADTAGEALVGGTNKTVTGEEHQEFLDKIEAYSVNAIGVMSEEEVTKKLYVNFTKRMRDDIGKKTQLVVFGEAADYEGVVNLVTEAEEGKTKLIPWVTGIIAGCPVEESNTNKLYDGEFTPKADKTQAEMVESIEKGEFVLHAVGDEVHVLVDINSLTTVTEEKGEVFKENKTIRITDQIAADFANVFNTKYLGKIPNDDSGRVSLWTDGYKILKELADKRAIEDVTDEDISVVEGTSVKAVSINANITVIGTMEQLYMVVKVQ